MKESSQPIKLHSHCEYAPGQVTVKGANSLLVFFASVHTSHHDDVTGRSKGAREFFERTFDTDVKGSPADIY